MLRPLGLADVITGGQSGVIFDAHRGVLEPVPDVAERAALDRRYEAERAERLAEQGRAILNRSRVQLAERRRARGRQDSYVLGVSQPALPHVTDLGAEGLFIEGTSAPAADGFTVVSAPSRPSLLSRLLGRLRRPG